MNKFLATVGRGLILIAVPTEARADFSWEVEITVRYPEAPLFGHWDRGWVYECQVWDAAVKQWKSIGPPNAMWDASQSCTWRTSMPVGKANGKYFVQIVKTKGGKDRTEIPWDQIT